MPRDFKHSKEKFENLGQLQELFWSNSVIINRLIETNELRTELNLIEGVSS